MYVCILLADGQRVANTTVIDTLVDKDFQLVINDAVYDVASPEKGTNPSVVRKQSSFSLLHNSKSLSSPLHLVASSAAVCVSSEHVAELEDIKHVVHLLHTALHQPEHHLLKEKQLLERLDELNQQLSPLEKVDDMLRRVYVMNGQVNHPFNFFLNR